MAAAPLAAAGGDDTVLPSQIPVKNMDGQELDLHSVWVRTLSVRTM